MIKAIINRSTFTDNAPDLLVAPWKAKLVEVQKNAVKSANSSPKWEVSIGINFEGLKYSKLKVISFNQWK